MNSQEEHQVRSHALSFLLALAITATVLASGGARFHEGADDGGGGPGPSGSRGDWTNPNPSERPYARADHAMAYDSQSDRIIVFGGNPGFRDTWAYDPASNVWTRMSPAATPRMYYGHAMAYDAKSDRIILYGGRTTGGYLTDETWAYDYEADTWTKTSPSRRPLARFWHAMAYDAQSDRIVLFGGHHDGYPDMSDETWAYDYEADTWTQRTPAARPLPRRSHAMAYDAQSDRIVLFGGIEGPPVHNDTWAYDYEADTWTEMGSAVAPSERLGHAMAYDARSDLIVLFGGSYSSGTPFDDTWTYDLDADMWMRRNPSESPSARTFHRMEYASGLDLVVLFGGYAGGVNSETWWYHTSGANDAPRVIAFTATAAREGEAVTFAVDASDPDGDELMYSFDLDSDGVFEVMGPSSVVAWTYGDDYMGIATVVVSDGQDLAEATVTFSVANVAPTVDGFAATATVDVTLRVAGEKWHDVALELSNGDFEVMTASVIRSPGSPNDQSVVVPDVAVDLLVEGWTAVVTYTPLDDPVSGQVWGADPAWLIFKGRDGATTVFRHTFNARHEDTWTWTVDDLRGALVGLPIEFSATGTDPGSDDLTFAWSWGDGTPEERAMYFNDGVGPDPFPSPDVNPILIVDGVTHAFNSRGAYVITVTVEDDDGGISVCTWTLILP